MNIFNFIFRILFCTLTFHAKGDKIQSHKAHDVYACKRCGNLFTITKTKYKKQ